MTMHQESKILPTCYLISIETCQSVLASTNFKLLGCEKGEIRLSTSKIMKVQQAKTETVETFDYSATFMTRKGRGKGCAHPFERITPLSDTIDGSVLINGRLTIGKLCSTKEM